MAPSGAFCLNLTTESRLMPQVRPWCLLLAVALLLAYTPPAFGQFASAVNVVELYSSVTDANGEPLPGLTKDDFVVKENGEVQQVSTFAAGEFPLSVALALDRSFSMAGRRLEAARSAARVFLAELRHADESMLLAIGSTIDVVTPLSNDRESQYSALAKLDAFGTTALHDSIIAAIDAIQQARGRRALILLSDGADRYSTATAASALARARVADVLIYPVAFGSSRPPLFAELAALTGGRSSQVENALRLSETLRSIARELRNQYLLGYSPSRPIVPGSQEWRAIDVTVKRSGARVRARDGYVAR